MRTIPRLVHRAHVPNDLSDVPSQLLLDLPQGSWERGTYGDHLHGAKRIPHHHAAPARARSEHRACFGTADHSAWWGIMQEGDQFL